MSVISSPPDPKNGGTDLVTVRIVALALAAIAMGCLVSVDVVTLCGGTVPPCINVMAGGAIGALASVLSLVKRGNQ